MRTPLKALFLGFLPALVFVLLLIGSRLLVGRSVPPLADWVCLLGSAALVALNPAFRKFETTWLRAVVLIMGFGLWSVLLFYLSFWIMGGVFSEWL